MIAATMVGCGSDDDSGDSASGGTSSSAAEEADPAAFCEAAVDLEAGLTTGGPEVDFETATPEEIEAALTDYREQVEPLLKEAEDSAPEEVTDDITSLTGQVRQGLESGDDSVFQSPEFMEANAGIDEYMLAECGYEQIEAVGVNYEYEGIPDTVPAGIVAVTFTNEGDEVHEIGVVRINDDVTEPLEQLLTLPEEEIFTKVEFAGIAFAEPSASDTVFLRMEEPGRYGGACFIPQGTTHDTEGSGPPHFTLGMFAEFTVE